MTLDTPTWAVTKQPAVSSRGVVAAQHRLAAEAGARMLARGGNAVDAAIAAALAVGVVEPWLSGIGGGGLMLVRPAGSGEVHAIDFSMIAARRLDPSRYAVVTGNDVDLFNWPKVEGDRNLRGYDSACVPGAIAGFGLALCRFGTMPWSEVIAPAIHLAETGMPVDWFASLSIAVEASSLADCPTCRSVLLPDGRPPVRREHGSERLLPNPALAKTLRRLAESGPQDFYTGETARLIAEDLAEGGSVIDAGDLAAYRARVRAPLTLDYRGTLLHAMPGLTGGPTYLAALSALKTGLHRERGLGAEAFAAYAKALTDAYAHRLAHDGHAATPDDPGCTSHVSVIDADGTMVALTNSLLSRFGAKVMLKQTGILMNNGMMWFDPRPGRPNSIAAGKRPLANMCPVLATRDGAPAFVMGAAGGRMIVPALVQLTSFLVDFGLALDAAFQVPRLDASTPTVMCDTRMPAAYVAQIGQSLPVGRTEDTVYPVQFAVPNAVQHDRAAGRNIGMAHITTPWPVAVAEEAVI